MSCRRRAVTAMQGRRVARENKVEISGLIIPVMTLTRNTKSTHHQNSGRSARPLKSAYLEKQVLIDSTKVILIWVWLFCAQRNPIIFNAILLCKRCQQSNFVEI